MVLNVEWTAFAVSRISGTDFRRCVVDKVVLQMDSAHVAFLICAKYVCIVSGNCKDATMGASDCAALHFPSKEDSRWLVTGASKRGWTTWYACDRSAQLTFKHHLMEGDTGKKRKYERSTKRKCGARVSITAKWMRPRPGCRFPTCDVATEPTESTIIAHWFRRVCF